MRPEVGDEDGDRAPGDGVDVEGDGKPEEQGDEGFAGVWDAGDRVAGVEDGLAGVGGGLFAEEPGSGEGGRPW